MALQSGIILDYRIFYNNISEFLAIYLAKRNIRKRGMLELHEQVKTDYRIYLHLFRIALIESVNWGTVLLIYVWCLFYNK